ncbi:hypothetical protein EDB80DRAFT_711846 [Ilyonectria destructans]|nr:hypothetical protein EDB80DRAFT_711846 [Ilyonectria destructans]
MSCIRVKQRCFFAPLCIMLVLELHGALSDGLVDLVNRCAFSRWGAHDNSSTKDVGAIGLRCIASRSGIREGASRRCPKPFGMFRMLVGNLLSLRAVL